MAQKLTEITTHYHTFVDNQVLTSRQLNDFISYFEDQDRLSRVFLHGVGTVCGFKVNYDSSQKTITVTQGAGVTTDGDLLFLRNPKEESPLKEIEADQTEFKYFRKFEDKFAGYSFLKKEETVDGETNDVPFELFEILPEQTENNEKELSELADLDKKVILLYLESFVREGNLCTSIDCDNQGEEQVARLRVLLVSEDDAEYISNLDPVFTWHNITEKYTNLPEIKTPRVDLSEANDLGAIRNKFLDAMSETLINKLKSGYEFIFELFNKSTISAGIDTLFDFDSESSEITDFQYRYDLLSDLIDTYNEIKELLLHINVECCPDIGSFPKHIFLGKVVESEIYTTYRHRFYKSPLSTTEDLNRKKVISLANRAEQLVENYEFSQTDTIRITPSKSSGCLGRKAIPVYYDLDDNFLNYWSFNKFLNLKQKFNLSYHVNALTNEPEIRQPLLFSTENYDFFRIEGHLGSRALEARDSINSEKKNHGLDFDCIVFDLDNNQQSFGSFIREHPPLGHRAGVSKGGTFVIVAENDETVADFCLPYKIQADIEEQGCCSLMECTYPWISSLKYLNNLARSLKGTQSRNKPMPDNYVLQVIEYRINKQSLIGRTVTLNIPLEKIFLRRMHAITEALNNRFDKGVVFDFNEDQKRFVITRAKEDTYTIRFRDATMGNNNPVYTYSNKGMFRNNKIFRPDAMRCRDLKKYNPDFYKKLHDKIAPVNKDDDYGAFDEKWRKWNVLKERLANHPVFEGNELSRTIKAFTDLPPEIQAKLRELKAEFQQHAETDLRFMLDGDWVTGEWVNETMLDHYRRNKKDTHDDIVLFVNLRKFLHSETGVTKLSLYIANQEYNPAFDDLIEKYSQFADIYFGIPSGENAITV